MTTDKNEEKIKEKVLEVPFNKWSKKKIEQGKKCCTSRNKQYRGFGDYTIQLPLWFVKRYLFIQEGADSPGEFEKIWKKVYRGKFDKNKLVFVHFFDNPEFKNRIQETSKQYKKKIEDIFNYVELQRKKDKKVAPDDLEYWIGRTKELVLNLLKDDDNEN